VKYITRTFWALVVLLVITVGLLAGTVAIGLQGYHALTKEELAARISVSPVAPQRFAATLRFADGKVARFDLAGDEIYVDARILKWKPAVNIAGVHTAYELDRIAGRYRALEDERRKPRTIHDLGRSKAVDLFEIRRRFAFLGEIFDAEYGSGTFVPVNQPTELELRVSTTGLLLREAKK
jgi:hypothetical protein